MESWQDLLRCQWKEGAEDPSTGFLDCRGVVKEVFRRGGRTFQLPGDWVEVEDLRDLRPYDVVATYDPSAEEHTRRARVNGESGPICVSHIGVAVGHGRSGLVLSAGFAGVFAMPACRIHHRAGVYRERGR